MRASYRKGVEWIAINDEPNEMRMEEINGLISVLLLADLFGKDPDKVAWDVIRERVKGGES